MSVILASSSAPRPSANPAPNASNASARGDMPAEDAASSFGAALSRSLQPAGKAVDKSADKTADKDSSKAAPAKRQADKAKSGMEDLINAMAIGLVPPESRIVKAVPSGDAAAGAVTRVALTATGDTTTPGAATATTATVTASAGAGAAAPTNALAASAVAVLAIVQKTITPNVSAPAAALNTDTARQTMLAPAFAEAVAPVTGATSTTGTRAASPSALTAAPDIAPLALTPGVVAGPNAAPESSLGAQPEHRNSQGAIELTGMRAVKDAAIDLSAVQARGTAKISADLSSPASESAAISVVSSQAPDVATASTDASLQSATLLAPPPSAAALANAAAPEAVSTASLAPDVGSSEWGKSLGQQIMHMGKAGQPLAELQLNPPGLGPLKVTLSMNDQQMQASFVSAHASVRVAIEAALPQLRSTLAESGINLGNTSVSSESQQQQAFADRPGEQASQRSYRPASVLNDAAQATRPAATPLPRAGVRSASSVDTYA
jgi:flagellar hook-length control protein FliK